MFIQDVNKEYWNTDYMVKIYVEGSFVEAQMESGARPVFAEDTDIKVLEEWLERLMVLIAGERRR